MPRVVVLITPNSKPLEEILSAWHDAGAPSVTVFDCVGTRTSDEQSGREDIPLLPTIRALLQSDEAPRKAVLAVVPDVIVDALVRASEEVIGDLSDEGNGILFSLPAGRVVGLRSPTPL
jgi:hypothetical protein